MSRGLTGPRLCVSSARQRHRNPPRVDGDRLTHLSSSLLPGLSVSRFPIRSEAGSCVGEKNFLSTVDSFFRNVHVETSRPTKNRTVVAGREQGVLSVVPPRGVKNWIGFRLTTPWTLQEQPKATTFANLFCIST